MTASDLREMLEKAKKAREVFVGPLGVVRPLKDALEAVDALAGLVQHLADEMRTPAIAADNPWRSRLFADAALVAEVLGGRDG